jgi:chorismate synthase
MSGNKIGNIFNVTTFGESHGIGLGAIIDGIPAGLSVSREELARELKRRAPGQHLIHTARKEEDLPEIISGVFEDKTLGSPICVLVRNTNQISSDYSHLKNTFRPGHADETTILKYGIRDHRGGGRASGRETLARVIGGYFAGLVIPDISCYAYIDQISHLKLKNPPQNHQVDRGEINIPCPEMTLEAIEYLKECKKLGESAGGTITLSIKNCPAALGEPVFDKLKADFAKAFLSLPACIGFSVDDGFNNALLKGSELSSKRSYFGGIEGGISNGDDILLKLAFKAPSTIKENALSGRHDPCILPRVIPVVEAMAKIILADHYLRQMSYKTFQSLRADQSDQ